MGGGRGVAGPGAYIHLFMHNLYIVYPIHAHIYNIKNYLQIHA